LNAVALTGGFFGMLDAVLVGVARGVSPWLGWLLVPVNASWGLLGNILGMMHRLASWNFYEDHGGFNKGLDRQCFTCFGKGFQLKEDYWFTAGWVTTCDENMLPHERTHVLQHLILGPIFVLSYAGWFLFMAVPGVIFGLAKRGSLSDGVSDLSYYNNPWEVIAYAFKGTRYQVTSSGDGSVMHKDLIFQDWFAWIVTVLWVLGSIGGAVSLVVLEFS
jgi:hypothetical protein